MDNNYTVLAALLTAVAAIIAPVISNIVSCIKEYRMKKMEIVYTQKLKLIVDFASAFESIESGFNDSKAAEAQSAASALATICKNKEVREKLMDLSNNLRDNPSRNPHNSHIFDECIMLISEEMSKTRLPN